MAFWIPMAVGAGLGLLKNQGDQARIKKQNQAAAAQTEYSALTGMGPGQIQSAPSPLEGAMQGAMAGAQFGMAGKQAGLWGQDAKPPTPDYTADASNQFGQSPSQQAQQTLYGNGGQFQMPGSYWDKMNRPA